MKEKTLLEIYIGMFVVLCAGSFYIQSLKFTLVTISGLVLSSILRYFVYKKDQKANLDRFNKLKEVYKSDKIYQKYFSAGWTRYSSIYPYDKVVWSIPSRWNKEKINLKTYDSQIDYPEPSALISTEYFAD